MGAGGDVARRVRGAAQFSAVGIPPAGGGPLAAAAMGLLLNTLTAAFSLAVADVLGPGRVRELLAGAAMVLLVALPATGALWRWGWR